MQCRSNSERVGIKRDLRKQAACFALCKSFVWMWENIFFKLNPCEWQQSEKDPVVTYHLRKASLLLCTQESFVFIWGFQKNPYFVSVLSWISQETIRNRKSKRMFPTTLISTSYISIKININRDWRKQADCFAAINVLFWFEDFKNIQILPYIVQLNLSRNNQEMKG